MWLVFKFFGGSSDFFKDMNIFSPVNTKISPINFLTELAVR